MNRTREILQARSREQVKAASRLFQEYAAFTGLDLCFQGFAEELAGLPGAYAPPTGRLLLGRCGGEWAGCVALRPFSQNIGELKRLYVRPAFRRQGLGRALVHGVIQAARQIGYSRMRLDTLDLMKEALTLYDSFGFRPIEPYRHNPYSGAIYLELALAETPRADSTR